MKLLKDYDLQIEYHPGKVNVVADALSRKTQHSLNTILITQMTLLRELENISVQLVKHGQADVQLSTLSLEPLLVEEIQINQETDSELQRIKKNLAKESRLDFLCMQMDPGDFKIVCAYLTM